MGWPSSKSNSLADNTRNLNADRFRAEIDGTALTMEDNYIMLLGPAVMTAFFFVMQFRMDASARDGSLYAAQKQAYLDEMEKYVEAKKAYLELFTLQAQVKKEQLMDGESE